MNPVILCYYQRHSVEWSYHDSIEEAYTFVSYMEDYEECGTWWIHGDEELDGGEAYQAWLDERESQQKVKQSSPEKEYIEFSFKVLEPNTGKSIPMRAFSPIEQADEQIKKMRAAGVELVREEIAWF